MSAAYRCDRCGAFFTTLPRDRFKIYKDKREGNIHDGSPLDLCSNCDAELNLFLQGIRLNKSWEKKKE